MLSAAQIKHGISASLAILLTLIGNAGTVVLLNWWLAAFPGGTSAPFAIQLSSSLIYLAVFLLALVVMVPFYGPKVIYKVIRRKGWRGVFLSVFMGLMDLLSNIVVVYAATHVPEILQAFLESTIPPWTLLLSYFLVKNQRALRYKSPWLIGSIVLCVVGIVASAIPAHPKVRSKYTADLGSFIAWIVIYATSATMYAGWCVIQRQYCDIVSTSDLLTLLREDDDREGGRVFFGLLSSILRGKSSVERTGLLLNAQTNGEKPKDQLEKEKGGKDVDAEIMLGSLEKTLMLLGDTFFQVLWTIVILPIDALPWFGTSPNIQSTWTNLVAGFHCVFTCPQNFTYCFFYSFCYFITYIGSAYLNHVSPTLSSIIIQLSAPVTAVLLLVIPAWNISAGGSEGVLWWQQSIAVVVMTVSAILYYRWERVEEKLLEAQATQEEAESA